MELRYLDAHCHPQFDDYDGDRDPLLERMREEGVGGIVVGCDFESSRKAVELAMEHEHLYAAVGLHPNVSGEEWSTDSYRFLADSPKCVAIGECGLDYFRNDATDEVKRAQEERLRAQIALAAELDKPLIIHCRPSKGTTDAYEDLVGILKEEKLAHPKLKGDIHFFVGDERLMREFVALNFTVSYTAVVTFARDYDEVIKAAPLESLLVETDSPYVAPASRRGQRNDPLAIPEIVAKLAEVRGEDTETVREALLANARRLFDIPSL